MYLLDFILPCCCFMVWTIVVAESMPHDWTSNLLKPL